MCLADYKNYEESYREEYFTVYIRCRSNLNSKFQPRLNLNFLRFLTLIIHNKAQETKAIEIQPS